MPNLRLRLKLSAKLLIFLLALSSVPLFIINLIWFFSLKQQIVAVTSDQVSEVINHAKTEITNFLTTKIVSLIIHAQTNAVLTQKLPEITQELKDFLSQDQDIKDVRLLSQNGQEIVHIARDKVYAETELTDESTSTAFKITTFVGGDRYISPVYKTSTGEQVIDIAIPIVSPETAQSLSNLSTSATGAARTPGEIFGVLIETVTLSKLWLNLNSLRIGDRGYIFVVDHTGRVLTHPDPQFLQKEKSLATVTEVAQFVNSRLGNTESNQLGPQMTNEFGQAVLTTHVTIQPTQWGVIGEVPLTDTLTQTNRILLFAIILIVIFLLFNGLLSLAIAHHITSPILELSRGSQYIGQGNFDYRLDIKTGDEIESLSHSFNSMADHLQEAFAKVEYDKNVLSAERNKLAVILSGIHDPVIAVDLKGKIMLFNTAAEQLMQLSNQEVIGKHLSEVFKLFDANGEILPNTFAPIRTDQFEGIIFSQTNLKLVSAKSKEVYVDLVSGKIKESQTSFLGCILTFHDVTEIKQLEDMKLDFVSMAAHELRTPLTSIKGYTELLIDEVGARLDSKHQEDLHRLVISTQNLGNLIDNLLNVSRIEQDTFNIELAPINLVTVIEETIKNVHPQAEVKQQQLTFTLPQKEVPLVMADRFRISQVLSNLLANAITYTPREGRIVVNLTHQKNTTAQEEYVVVAVTDTGQGLPKEALPKLFTKFFRVSGVLEQGSKGTGLGLFIAKSIVTMHKGKIWVESTLGKGSTFTFMLPVATVTDIVDYKQSLGTALSNQNPHGIMLNKDRYQKRLLGIDSQTNSNKSIIRQKS